MEPVLFLVHRIPFPPNKGDKVRSFHLLRFLAARYRVHVGTFVDDPADLVHVPRLLEHCASAKVVVLRRALARVRSLHALLTGEPFTTSYYRDAELAAWVDAVVREQRIRKVVVFSSAMAQYAAAVPHARVVVDFVDVDSAKWRQYGESRAWPLSALFEREGARLLALERSVARAADASVFVTPAEADLFRSLAPECAERVRYAQNGVDTAYFAPHPERASPMREDEEALVFTGAMDYWPNVDAVSWFAREVLPRVAEARPRTRFYVVGMNPAPAVEALARDPRVVVTGRVDDVRPYLQHARVVVAPMRVARGIQNKVLEAMAMGRPVVVSAAASGALTGVPGVDYETADSADDFVRATVALLDAERGSAVGAAARRRAVADYDWTANLAPFDEMLREPAAAVAVMA